MVKLFAVPSDPFCCSLAECNLGDEISPAAYSYLKINKRGKLNLQVKFERLFFITKDHAVSNPAP